MLPIKTKLFIGFFAVFLLLQSIFLSACSNSFHLREEVKLPEIYQQIQLENISLESDFGKVFENALEEAGGQLTSAQLVTAPLIKSDSSNINAKRAAYNTANAKVIIDNLREGKRVVAYTSERKARIYLVFLKLEYTIQNKNRQKHPKQSINLDKTFI